MGKKLFSRAVQCSALRARVCVGRSKKRVLDLLLFCCWRGSCLSGGFFLKLFTKMNTNRL